MPFGNNDDGISIDRIIADASGLVTGGMKAFNNVSQAMNQFEDSRRNISPQQGYPQYGGYQQPYQQPQSYGYGYADTTNMGNGWNGFGSFSQPQQQMDPQGYPGFYDPEYGANPYSTGGGWR